MSCDKNVVCHLCQKTFTRLHDMKRHQQNIHNNSDEITHKNRCPICQKTFARSSYVKKHQETVHKLDNVSDLIVQIDELKIKNEQLELKLEKIISNSKLSSVNKSMI